MIVRHGHLYLADLDPHFGSEPGKQRPVVVVQSDLLNRTGHPSTWVLPCTTRLTGDSVLRTLIPAGAAGNRQECEVMIDQSRAIDNRRFRKALGSLPALVLGDLKQKLKTLAEI